VWDSASKDYFNNQYLIFFCVAYWDVEHLRLLSCDAS